MGNELSHIVSPFEPKQPELHPDFCPTCQSMFSPSGVNSLANRGYLHNGFSSIRTSAQHGCRFCTFLYTSLAKENWLGMSTHFDAENLRLEFEIQQTDRQDRTDNPMPEVAPGFPRFYRLDVHPVLDKSVHFSPPDSTSEAGNIEWALDLHLKGRGSRHLGFYVAFADQGLELSGCCWFGRRR